MEVVAAPPAPAGGAPYRDHDVREWSRIDTITGALERARLETDSWTASTSDACHKYGKVIDSRARTGADGSLQAQASRQLEIFQSRAAGASLHVVKTKTVSSSRWSGTGDAHGTEFEGLQIPLNLLDLSSQKSKASVGRSVSRRPPSRQPRAPNFPSADDHSHIKNAHFTAATNLHRVSRLCHQIHESAVRNAFARRDSGDSNSGSSSGGVKITEVESSANSNSDILTHANLNRTKSTSSEDIQHQAIEKEAKEGGGPINGILERSSQVRRSLQHHNSDTTTTKVNVRRIRDELEKGRRLNAALRNNSLSGDTEALDQIIQSISSTSSIEKCSTDDNLDDERLISKPKTKRESFVTVQTLQEVRDKLRRTSSPPPLEHLDKIIIDEASDDGIVTEEAAASPSKVRSYVYGMESLLQSKKPIMGTGSLESKAKLVNGSASHKNEDWYNRRKSYGFEKVHDQEESTSMGLKNKNFPESSTDSGICRSSEIVVVPTTTNGINCGNVRKMTSIFDKETSWKPNNDTIKSTTITIPIVKNNNVVDLSWNDEPENERKTSLADLYTRDDYLFDNRKTKKVEFCKTEVHFAAESGKVNIVETDEKPPPTQNFRRRRRNSCLRDDYQKNGLPVLHFGDSSYEKNMFGITDSDHEDPDPRVPPNAFGMVTVNNDKYPEDDKKDLLLLLESDTPKGILKNKPLKPKPYHLGETAVDSNSEDTEDNRRWGGVRLRHVPTNNDDPTPIWKSTVTVRNSYQDQPEFQKLLRNLRPTTKKPDYLSDNENRYSDGFVKENRRSSWSVADRVNSADEVHENRGYSTKVNFGNGGATVVETDQATWPRMENLTKDNLSDRLTDISTESKKPNATYNRYSIPSSNSKFSPVVLRKTIPITTEENDSDKQQTKFVRENVVLRQPKKSEMTYFGVNVSPKAAIKRDKKLLEKPDLLQHHHPQQPAKLKPRKPSPDRNVSSSNTPIYENLKPLRTTKAKYSSNREFDSSILEELTKAADQILQAVNGYTDEDCQNRLSSDEEEEAASKKPFLDTISETKSWQNKSSQDLEAKNQQRMRPTLASAAKVRVKRTSSTSSVESTSIKDSRRNTKQMISSLAERKQVAKSSAPHDKAKKKISSDSSSTKASTKARRLQRASSREALLQSHGSSSEDLPSEAPLRKPRLIKKTKATQLTVTNGLELKRPPRRSREEKRDDNNTRSSDRVTGTSTEIRHKTAVSTITSSTRDRSRTRSTEDSRLKSHAKRDSSLKGSMSGSSMRPTTSSSRAHNQRPIAAAHKESAVTQHRISTANIKKCHRSEGASRR